MPLARESDAAADLGVTVNKEPDPDIEGFDVSDVRETESAAGAGITDDVGPGDGVTSSCGSSTDTWFWRFMETAVCSRDDGEC